VLRQSNPQLENMLKGVAQGARPTPTPEPESVEDTSTEEASLDEEGTEIETETPFAEP